MNIDVSELLFPKVCNFDFIQSIDSFVSSIVLTDWTCNDADYTIFDFSRFTQVESIEIGNNSFCSVQTFKIDGLNRLKTIKIGNNSFTQLKQEWFSSYHNDYEWNSTVNSQSKSFHILNCESLESIEIGENSFRYFGGKFELNNLPQLQYIIIGTIGSNSGNFSDSPFVIRGIELILSN